MISIIMPTYRRYSTLMARAIPSVFHQTDPDWELLVVGDGTDEQSAEAVETLANSDKRVKFWNLAHDVYPPTHDQAWGLYGLTALNFGLDWARGEWIAVLNDDDAFTPEHNQVLLKAALNSEADFVYGMSDTLKGNPPGTTGQMYGAWPPGDGNVTQGSYIYRRSLEYRYRHDCLDRGLNGDADMWTRMYADGVKFHFEPRIVHHYFRNFP